MDVLSLSPLPVASLRWYDRYARPVLTFVARATFALAPVESRLAEHQEAPGEHDNHWDDDPSRSLRAASDLAPFKPRAEVVVVGSACAPRGERVRVLRARLVVGEVDKSIEAFGDRVFAQDGTLREGARFAKMALRYERAAGGAGTSNPVGVSPDLSDTFGQIPLPNLQPPGVEIGSPRDHVEPIGLGPIAPGWPERRERLRQHAQAFLSGAWAGQALPDDLDLGFFNAAPRDQQLDALRDNERIVLENLHPEIPRLVTNLPGVRPRAFAEIPGSPPRELGMVCDTLWIDTDSGLCTLTWRGQLALERQDGRIFVVMEQAGQRVSWDDVERLRAHRDPKSAPAMRASQPSILPFGQVGKAAARPPAPSSPALSSPDASRPPRAQTMDVSALQQMAQALDASPSWLAGQPSSAAPVPAPPPRPPLPSRPPAGDGPPLRPPSPPGPTRMSAPRPATAAPALVPAPVREPPALIPAPVRENLASVPAPVRETPALVPPPAWETPAPVPAPAWEPPAPVPASARETAAPAASEPGLRAKPLGDPLRKTAASATSALGASNAALPPEEKRERAYAAPREAPAAPANRVPAGEYVDLVWLDPDGLARARMHKPLYPLFSPEKKAVDAWLDHGPAPKSSQEQRDRADALRVLSRSRALDDAGMTQAMIDAIGDDGAFSAPIAVIGGELHFRFDEIETLKAMVVALSPLAPGDKKLKDLCDSAADVLRSPWLTSGSGVAEAMTARMREAFAQQNRSLPATYLERTVDRALLEQRRYQKRTLVGGEMIRALLFAPGGPSPVPAYLPVAAGPKLPLFPSLKVHILADVLSQQDQSEPHAAALAVIALGRVSPVPSRAR